MIQPKFVVLTSGNDGTKTEILKTHTAGKMKEFSAGVFAWKKHPGVVWGSRKFMHLEITKSSWLSQVTNKHCWHWSSTRKGWVWFCEDIKKRKSTRNEVSGVLRKGRLRTKIHCSMIWDSCLTRWDMICIGHLYLSKMFFGVRISRCLVQYVVSMEYSKHNCSTLINQK